MKYIKNFNESKDDDLCRPVEKEEYDNWTNRILSKTPSNKAIDIIIDQISKIEGSFNRVFIDKYLDIDYKLYPYSPYNGTIYGNDVLIDKKCVYYRRISVIRNNPDLHIWISECDDYWYIVEIYHNWGYYFFICDDLVGLEELGDAVISEFEKNDDPF